MNNIKILIVEDEPIVALEIKRALQKLGYEVVGVAKNYTSALQHFKKYLPSIVFMDIHLNKSKKDGIEIAKEFKKIKDIPIVYLTAYSDDDTLNRAIQTDPVSYLVKPFKIKELYSTILLAEAKVTSPTQTHLDTPYIDLGYGYYYDTKDETLFLKNTYIKLSGKEKELFIILLNAKGRLILNDDLKTMLWPNETVANSSLRTLIYRLRSKLEATMIETVHSTGCKLLVD